MEISIPTTQLSTNPKPHTTYTISLRLPLRSFTLQKRFSDFLTLHSQLTSQASAAPPISPPPKSYFSNTTHNPALAESRRVALEKYLQTIGSCPDARWRDTSAWRAFLNLPSSVSAKSSVASNLHGTISSAASGPVTDPVVWLDTHRELKAQLHEARLQITRRDQAAGNTQAQHEASAQAKKSLVKAGGTIATLAEGLQKSGDEWGSQKLGEGEVRRRKDLVAAARREKESLEGLLNAMVAKAQVDAAMADKGALLGMGAAATNGAGKKAVGSGRVLGKETARTRELDNAGVLQLQQQMMMEQDEDVSVLAAAVRRQRELGEQINQELVVQNEMLGMLDEDVTRVAGKVEVARKRVAKIS
ncbi:hypothetical protein MMC11_001176 [Xylographa trunciseda]|nr:hypothetical protein [Xylographa trunciseda]